MNEVVGKCTLRLSLISEFGFELHYKTTAGNGTTFFVARILLLK
jgi:hypothetical protein